MESVPAFDQPPKMKLSGHDQAVMATSNDAIATKVYAAQLGYFRDDYSKLFLKKYSHQQRRGRSHMADWRKLDANLEWEPLFGRFDLFFRKLEVLDLKN